MTAVYLIIAGVGAVLAVGWLAALVVRLRAPAGAELTKLPMTWLQKRAWLGLAVGTLTAAAILGLLLTHGVAAWFDDRSVRLAFLGLLVAGAAAYGISVRLTRPRGGEASLDERDRRVLAQAPRVQSAAVLGTLGVWTVALTEVYWKQQAIPIQFPYLIFWSCLIVHILGLSVGILVGYRLAALHGEG